ncbi:hypothetical protein AVEN_18215-1 [Araneus ventricosus]|uniref:Uncharacterized protein n=1 Tax=Araneus ventricosus TaxID=182803 RepID=A0A4Y2AIL5_ARAVE|nr:hypothetical protein AVEN_18215-1 [Araneus ventricosus]
MELSGVVSVLASRGTYSSRSSHFTVKIWLRGHLGFNQKVMKKNTILPQLASNKADNATSHGKGCIDGIGETIKLCVREVSSARKADPRTSLEFANDAKKICTGINILYESEEQIEAIKAKLDEMWVTNSQEI